MTASIGHNSNITSEQRTKLSGIISEIEHFEEQKREISQQVAEILKAAKEQGFDTKAIREVIKQRRMEKEAREAFLNAVDSYKHALGDLNETPLGDAATAREFGGPVDTGMTDNVVALKNKADKVKKSRRKKHDKPPAAEFVGPDVSTQPFRPDLDIPPFLDRRISDKPANIDDEVPQAAP